MLLVYVIYIFVFSEKISSNWISTAAKMTLIEGAQGERDAPAYTCTHTLRMYSQAHVDWGNDSVWVLGFF